jgi:hypothetical protein
MTINEVAFSWELFLGALATLMGTCEHQLQQLKLLNWMS